MSSRANSGISLHPSKRGDWTACTRVGSAGGWECARWHIELEWWGAAGFAGAELVRLLASHPSFELVVITSNADAGEPFSSVYPAYKGVTDLTFAAHDDPGLAECDAAFWPCPIPPPWPWRPAFLPKAFRCSIFRPTTGCPALRRTSDGTACSILRRGFWKHALLVCRSSFPPILITLRRAIAADGEGASRPVTVTVQGAATL